MTSPTTTARRLLKDGRTLAYIRGWLKAGGTPLHEINAILAKLKGGLV